MSPVRIVLADDQGAFRRGLHVALEEAGASIEVVAEADSGEAAVDAVSQWHPDVVVLDVRMPGVGGITAARAISAVAPDVHILMLTISDDPADVAAAMEAGATGYLLKERSLEDIADAVLALAEGKTWPAAIA
jgi:DNA-binding NarL/FixJ family response regulator